MVPCTRDSWQLRFVMGAFQNLGRTMGCSS
jgi:hypothetical protein